MNEIVDTFGPNLSVAVIGGSGGIGQALTRCLMGSRNVKRVFNLGRRHCDPLGDTTFIPLDLENEASVAKAAETIKLETDYLHVILVATGILHAGTDMQPEKSRNAISAEAMAQAFRINAIGPALVAKHFFDLLPRHRKAAFAALGARVGSLSDNHLGGWYSYRASKAALHMLVRTFSIELGRTHPEALCIALHPGTVDTSLSKPFVRNQSRSKLLTPEQSAYALLSALNSRTSEDSGRIIAWDGSVIPF